jgi:hypothetical protein
MAHVKITPIMLLAWLFAAGCGQQFNTTKPETISTLEVHILYGFEDHWVFVEGGNGSLMQTFVENPSIPPGQQAVHHIEIHSDQSMLAVRRVPCDGNQISQSCYLSLQLDSGKNYILNLTRENSQIQTSLQEEPLEYY